MKPVKSVAQVSNICATTTTNTLVLKNVQYVVDRNLLMKDPYWNVGPVKFVRSVNSTQYVWWY